MRPPRLLLPALFLALCGCGGKGATEVREARVVLPPPGMEMAAGYFQIENTGSTPLELRRISSPVFESVEMHETLQDQGVSRMRTLEKLELPSHGGASFEPGGKHLMMFGFKQDLSKLSEIPMELELVAADGSVSRLGVQFALQAAGQGAH